MKKSLIAICISLFFVGSLAAKERLMIGNITFGPEAKAVISEDKVEAALYFANRLANRFEYIGLKTRDSVALSLKAENPDFTSDDLISRLNPDKMYFFHVDLLANMLRVNLKSKSRNGSEPIDAVGYATAHYYKEENDMPLYDTALLEAIQRAMAVCESDSAMFATSRDSVFYVLPAPTLVLSGLQFVSNPSFPKWEIFTDQEINSYFILESMYDTLKYRPDYVLYDIASRDSIYGLFNLKIPDNHRATNEVEFSCLARLEVDYVVSGSFVRTSAEEATLELILIKISDHTLTEVDRISTIIPEDKKPTLQAKARAAITELLDRQKK